MAAGASFAVIEDCGGGTDTVYFVPGQDAATDNCEIRNPRHPSLYPRHARQR